jgi:HK97 family phage prohead protease
MATETETASPEAGVSVRPPRENLIRALAEAPTLERSAPDAMPTLTGHFAVFDQWTEINSVHEGRFLERLASTSMDKTIAESRDQMRVLFQHGKDPQIGDKVLGPIAKLETDGTGARYEVPLLDTSYNRDLIPGLEAGLYGASFRFQVMNEEFESKPKRSEYNPEGLPERTITEARVREFGPVTFPAYAAATAGLRSLTDEFLFGKFIDNPDRLRELLEALVARSIVEPEPSEAATPPITPDPEPEPSAATTRAKPRSRVGLYPYREEKPQWLL